MYFFVINREQNKRLVHLETARSAPPTPSSLSDFATPPGQKLKTDLGTPESDLTPLGNESFSSANSEVTPQMDKLSLGRGRGRPRKKLSYSLNMDDFPETGTQEEKDKYLKKKQTELWRFKTLSGPKAAEHRAKENERVKKYQQRKKAEKLSSSLSAPPKEEDSDSDDSLTDRKREQSRKR